MEGDWRAGRAGDSLPQDVSLLGAAFPLWLQLTQDRPVLVPDSAGDPGCCLLSLSGQVQASGVFLTLLISGYYPDLWLLISSTISYIKTHAG